MPRPKLKRRPLHPQPQPGRTKPAPVYQVATPENPRFVFKPEVQDRCGLTYQAIWHKMREGTFPASRAVGNKVAWLEHEINEWIMNRPIRVYKAPEAA